MIGNTIEFIYWEDILTSRENKTATGLVVDAFTKVTGSVSGGSFLGIGETTGSTDSKRVYKVQFYESWDSQKKCIQFKDIEAWQMKKIISFAGQTNQELNEEKIQLSEN